MRKNCTNQQRVLKIDTFSGGGGDAILWTGVSDFKALESPFIYLKSCHPVKSQRLEPPELVRPA